MAGSSFLRARSPVTPNRTRTLGSAIFGILRSLGSRSGLFICPGRLPARSAAGRELSTTRARVELTPDRLDQACPRIGELLNALALEYLDHVVVADAELLELGEDLPGLVVVAGNGIPGRDAVIGRGVQRRLWHGVHRVRRDQFVHVLGVGVGRVLRASRRPQGPLQLPAALGQCLPPGAGEMLLEQLVREPG